MITYETLRKIEQDERDNRMLSQLPPRFFEEFADYIEKKERISKEKGDKFELQTATQRLQSILEMRERKLVNFTLSYVRSGAVPENMLDSEKELFESLVERIRDFHKKRDMALSSDKTSFRAVVFLQEFPVFVGIDMGHYGPYKTGDIATVPEENARLLVEKGSAEFLESE